MKKKLLAGMACGVMKKLLKRMASYISFIIFGQFIIAGNAFCLPVGYEDMGNYTIDHKSGLQWLDVTITRARSYNDVESDTALKSEGWRHASQEEFIELINGFFGITFTEPKFETTDSSLVEEFIFSFGDTYNDFLDQYQTYDDVSAKGNGLTIGLLPKFGQSGNVELTLARISDYELTIRSTGALVSDRADFIDLVDWSTVSLDSTDAATGHWLVRDSPPVPEPATMFLMGTGLAGLIGARRKKKK